jgi:hypothetical protein
MNQDHPAEGGADLLGDSRGGFALWLRMGTFLLPAIVPPLIGRAILRLSRRYFDYYELAGVLFIPVLYLVLGAYLYRLRSSFFRDCAAPPDVRRQLTGYKLTYVLALILLCLYEPFITIILSPGGPDQLTGTFWLWSAIFYPPYIGLLLASELYLRKASRLARLLRREAKVDRAETGSS